MRFIYFLNRLKVILFLPNENFSAKQEKNTHLTITIFISRQTFATLSDLVVGYQSAACKGLCCQLTKPCQKPQPREGRSNALEYATRDQYEIPRSQITLTKKLGENRIENSAYLFLHLLNYSTTNFHGLLWGLFQEKMIKFHFF